MGLFYLGRPQDHDHSQSGKRAIIKFVDDSTIIYSLCRGSAGQKELAMKGCGWQIIKLCTLTEMFILLE